MTGPVTPTITKGWPAKTEKMTPLTHDDRQTSTTPILPFVALSSRSAKVMAGAIEVKNM